MKACYKTKPPLLEKSGANYAVRMNLKKVDTDEGKMWECDEIMSPTTNYDDVVAAIIRASYSLNAEIAMVNNYLTEPGERQAEWEAYQTVRSNAKAYAGDTLGLAK